MNTPVVVRNSLVIKHPDSPVMGKKPRYWSKAGITIFFFEGDWVPDPATHENAVSVEPVLPGMVGVNWRGTQMFAIMTDGECVKLTDLTDDVPRGIMQHMFQIDNVDGKVPHAG